MRIHTRWNSKDKNVSIGASAEALGVVVWRVAAKGTLNLENEGFNTTSEMGRLNVIMEYACFAVHMVDRMVYDKIDDERRHKFVVTMAKHFAHTYYDNRIDYEKEGEVIDDFKKYFIDTLNERNAEYGSCDFSKEEGIGFSMKRFFGEHVRQEMGEKDNKWIPDYIIDKEVPELYRTLKRAMPGLLKAK